MFPHTNLYSSHAQVIIIVCTLTGSYLTHLQDVSVFVECAATGSAFQLIAIAICI